MAVIVHQHLVAERLARHAKPARPERAQADIGANDALFGDEHRRESRLPCGFATKILHQPATEPARRSAGRSKPCRTERHQSASCLHEFSP